MHHNQKAGKRIQKSFSGIFEFNAFTDEKISLIKPAFF
jgi:hypothetical protein